MTDLLLPVTPLFPRHLRRMQRDTFTATTVLKVADVTPSCDSSLTVWLVKMEAASVSSHRLLDH